MQEIRIYSLPALKQIDTTADLCQQFFTDIYTHFSGLIGSKLPSNWDFWRVCGALIALYFFMISQALEFSHMQTKALQGEKPRMRVMGLSPFTAMNSSVVTSLGWQDQFRGDMFGALNIGGSEGPQSYGFFWEHKETTIAGWYHILGI